MTENEISYKCTGIAVELHKNMGPELPESTYEDALAYELRKQGIEVQQQVPVPFEYKTIILELGYRIDLPINKKVINEVKSLETLAPVYFAQLLNNQSFQTFGLLNDFNTEMPKDGIRRIINRL